MQRINMTQLKELETKGHFTALGLSKASTDIGNRLRLEFKPLKVK